LVVEREPVIIAALDKDDFTYAGLRVDAADDSRSCVRSAKSGHYSFGACTNDVV
jgi:hypothetical protein